MLKLLSRVPLRILLTVLFPLLLVGLGSIQAYVSNQQLPPSTSPVPGGLKGGERVSGHPKGLPNVVIREDDLLFIRMTYHESLETGWCLEGRTFVNAYYIRSVRLAYMSEATSRSLKMRCKRSSAFLGTIHSHPSGSLYLSETDKESFSQHYTDEQIMGVYNLDQGLHLFSKSGIDPEKPTVLDQPLPLYVLPSMVEQDRKADSTSAEWSFDL